MASPKPRAKLRAETILGDHDYRIKHRIPTLAMQTQSTGPDGKGMHQEKRSNPATRSEAAIAGPKTGKCWVFARQRSSRSPVGPMLVAKPVTPGGSANSLGRPTAPGIENSLTRHQDADSSPPHRLSGLPDEKGSTR